MYRLKQEKRMILLVAYSFLGLLCQTEEVSSEEVKGISSSVLPMETSPLEEPLFTSGPVIEPLSYVHDAIFLPYLPHLDEDWTLQEGPPFHLPTGREVSLQHLQRKYAVGKRVEGQIYRPGTTLSLRVEGGLQNYMSWNTTDPYTAFFTEEERALWRLHLAETTLEAVQGLSIPFIGELAAGFLEAGKALEKAHRKMRNKYHLQIKYSDKTLKASYRKSF